VPHNAKHITSPDVSLVLRALSASPVGAAIMTKEIIRSAFRKMGLDVRRFSFLSSPDEQFRAMLAHHEINLVFDVGANTGQYSVELRRRFRYRGRIVSFEPLSSAHAQLLRAAATDALWEVAPRVALGQNVGSVALHVSGNSQSSSVLAMLDAHSSAAPESRYIRDEVVPMTTLDIVARGYASDDSRVLLKVDTQGYEAEVLRGAEQLLAKSSGVQMEMTLTPLYEGQMLMRDLWRILEDAGFELWSLSPVFVDRRSGRLLQIDATFFRKDRAGA
jgi:FkbM family methyltransferase